MTAASRARALDVQAQALCLAAEHALMAAPQMARNLAEAERRRVDGVALLEQSEVPVAVLALPSRAALFVNAAWRALFARGAAAFARLPPDVLDKIAAIGSGRDSLTFPDLALDASGPPQRVTLVVRSLHDAEGAIAGVVLVAAETTDANRMKDQFIAVVSHELRAPLTTMLLWEKVLRESGDNAALRARALEVIRFSVQTQSRIVGDLLDVSRAVSGKLYVDLRPVDIATIIHDALTAARPAVHARGIALVRETDSDLGAVEADAPRLRQVFENLLSNAIKFTEPGGSVTVSAERRVQSVVVSVTDDGRGITPEFMPRLFEAFTQMEDDLSRRAGGLGLGLTIAKQLVELHDGTLTASSAGAGRGATFTVTLPATRVRRAQTPPVGGAPNHRLHGVQILVVDDDARVRDALALLLERAGAVIRTADSAESARARIGEAVPDALVCDIAMPGEDGYTFMEAVRARGITAPAVAVTAHASEAAAKRALDAGFDRHLAKPIDIDHLITCLHELVSMSAR